MKISSEERFFRKVLISPFNECWEWLAYKLKGYGRFGNNGSVVYAHRYSYEFYNGKITNGLHVLHKCDNPGCVNPSHLFLGTQKENIADMFNKKRNPSRKGERGANKLTEKEVIYILNCLDNDICSGYSLAKKFNVCTSAIYGIKHRKRWNYLTS